ncbi:MAG: molybdopterin molybdotransferase MoeA [Gammaproteobacteria bacterium]|nr:molybdopterin molybdotransferase MoeA [Gammaproteobacteria bacterium]MYF38970.1 molybdopterin molybdotransferase MoeA [Gammaproteobacteria bacterium]
MLSVESAIKKLRAIVPQIKDYETIPLRSGVGRTLKRSITAPGHLPPFDNSAMDGYALCGPKVIKPGTRFTVVGDSRAGHPCGEQLDEGQACRIFTGAVVPIGTTTVVAQEDVLNGESDVMVNRECVGAENIRRRGMDAKKGMTIASNRDVLSPYSVGWCSAFGITEIEVVRRIKVAVFSTGDELRDPGEDLQPGQIYESNRATLVALLQSKSVELVDLGQLSDDPDEINKSLQSTAGQVDLIITSGGVSVGESDYVRPVIEEIGKLEFFSLALKPGKPLAVGTIDNALFFGLPGNPVSTIVTYLLFVAPAIDSMSGVPWHRPTHFQAKLTTSISHKSGRREYQRGVFVGDDRQLRVAATGDQSSNRLASFKDCNCLIVVPAHRDNLEAGEMVEILLLPNQRSIY